MTGKILKLYNWTKKALLRNFNYRTLKGFHIPPLITFHPAVEVICDHTQGIGLFKKF